MYRTALRRFFDALVARGLITSNPATEAGLGLAEPETKAGEQPLTMKSLPDQFAAFTTVERQATVDAASFALLQHAIRLFTEGQGGARADDALYEATIKLGESYGITPFAWGKTSAEGTPYGQEVGGGARLQPAPNDDGEIRP
jgi:hypothetical protein